jgi:uroporphyrinogen III methyltransferase/synthase
VTVFLVGAGPGDPGLITVRGAELLARADVVIYDRLSAPSLLELVPESAQRIYVGKRGSEGSTPQERINELLVEHGSSASVVVRLKGGDPFVFARGAEELEVLRDAGIPAEVVPGITSAIAAPAYAGIPVTRRYSSTSVTIVTGHEDPTKERSEVDWDAIARVGGTIVVLMGVANIGRISERLIAGGLAPQTPVAAVRWGTRPNQHTTRASLATIAEHPLAAPSVIVIGDVAADEFEWFAGRPLTGRRIVVTRAPAQASRLTDRLLAAGADVINVPTIAIADPPDGGAALAAAAAAVSTYDWVVLTSPNGAERFLAAVGDARRLAGVRLAVIGPGTAAVLRAHRMEPDLIPARYVAEGLLEDFPDGPGRVLIPQAREARPVLAEGLLERGFVVDVVPAYETVPADVPAGSLADIAGADAVAFASSSAVTNFVAAVPEASRPEVAVAIGPISAATARDAGFEVVEAAQHDLDGLVAAVLEWATAT